MFVVLFLFCMYNQKLALLSALISMWKKIIEGPAPKLIRILGGTWDGQSNFLTRDTHMDTPILCYVFAFKSYFWIGSHIVKVFLTSVVTMSLFFHTQVQKFSSVYMLPINVLMRAFIIWEEFHLQNSSISSSPHSWPVVVCMTHGLITIQLCLS